MGTAVRATICLGNHAGGSRGTDSSGRVARPALSSHATERSVRPAVRCAAAGACQGGMSPLKPLHASLLLSELFHYVPSGN